MASIPGPDEGGNSVPPTPGLGKVGLEAAYQAEVNKLLSYLVVAFSGFLVGLQLVLTILVYGPGKMPLHFAELVLFASNVITLFFGGVAVARYDLIAWIEEQAEVHTMFKKFGKGKHDGLTRRVSAAILHMERGLYGNRGASKYRIVLPSILGVVMVVGLWLALLKAYQTGICLPGITC